MIGIFKKIKNNLFHKIWILTIYRLIYRRKISSLNDLECNESCVIIGNGPSLFVSDLSLFINIDTFASNKIFLAFEHTEWRPTFYFVEDDLVYKQNKSVVDSSGFYKYKFINSFLINFGASGKGEPQTYLYNYKNADYLLGREPLSSDASKEIVCGYSVVVSQIQLAVYLGYKKIYLVGVDFSFDIDKDRSVNNKEIESNGDSNHFVENYRQVGELWNYPNLEKQYLAFQSVKMLADKYGVEILNASRSTKLDVFDTVDFNKVKWKEST